MNLLKKPLWGTVVLLALSSSIFAGAGDAFYFPVQDYGNADYFQLGDSRTGYGYHTADDINVPSGTAVYAIADGVVKKSGNDLSSNGIGGNYLIEHNTSDGIIVTVYQHLDGSNREFYLGETVSRGDLLGYTGTTGTNGTAGSASGTIQHLHFGIKKGPYGSSYDSSCYTATSAYAPYSGYTSCEDEVSGNSSTWYDPRDFIATELWNYSTKYDTNENNEWRFYKIHVPGSYARLKVTVDQIMGDVDLYVRENNNFPDYNNFDCRPYRAGSSTEVCSMGNANNKDFVIGIHGYAYQDSDFRLKIRLSRW